MTEEIGVTVPADVRGQVAALVRAHRSTLVGDLAAICTAEMPVTLSPQLWQRLAEQAIDLLATTIEHGEADPRDVGMAHFDVFGRGLMPMPLLFRAIYFAERVILDELALDDQLGATSEPWPLVAHFVRRASFDALSAFAERVASSPIDGVVRDALTTLVARPVFDLVLAQEVHRAQRHQHPLALLLIDIDDLANINAQYGFGVGDRVLERLGILARRYFRTHDWVARHAEDALAALLPQTSLADAADLAEGLRSTVEQRLPFKDERASMPVRVTVSVAVVGSDIIESELDPHYVIAEAEEAVRRAKLAGRNRVEKVALVPLSVSLLGAANLLECSASIIRRLIRSGHLTAARKGRHYHIERASVERYRVEQLAKMRGGQG